MPKGTVHNAINTVTLAAIGGVVVAARVSGHIAPDIQPMLTNTSAAAFAGSYLVGTFLVTPDLDLAEGNVDAKKHWGALGFLWVPYGLMFHHRGISHTYFPGPLTRLLYLLLMLAAIAGLASPLVKVLEQHYHFTLTLPTIHPGPVALAVLLGFFVSQWIHLLADGILPFSHHGRR